MPLTIKEMPKFERPYEKLTMYGAESLSDSELLAIIIKSGTKNENSLQIANRVMLLAKSLKELENLSQTDLEKVKGIGKVKAIQIKALCELTKRMANENNIDRVKMSKTSDVARFFMEKLRFEKNEKIFTIALNNANEVMKITEVTRGEKSASTSMSKLLAENIKLQSPKIIVVHNHPSGNCMPSAADYIFTKNVEEACKLFSIILLDHVIIGNNTYKSIVDDEKYKREYKLIRK